MGNSGSFIDRHINLQGKTLIVKPFYLNYRNDDALTREAGIRLMAN